MTDNEHSGTAGEPRTRGRLLVATPDLRDPNFIRTVVLMLEHNEDGALGVVLNRRSDTDVAELFPTWTAAVADPSVAFVGGPVAPESVIALARADSDEAPGWVPVVGGLGTVDLARDRHEIGAEVEVVRIFAGYAGWGPGQLEGELVAGGWFVFDARPEDPFSADPDGLWSAVLRRQGGRIAWFASCPPDPSVN